MADPLVAELRAAVGDDDRVLEGALALGLYARDASVIEGRAGAVVLPVSTEEVQAVVRVARRHGRAIVPRGSGTGLAGGAVPVAGDPERPPVVIVTTKMDRVLAVDVDDRVAWVQPGVLNLDLSHAVRRHGLHFAPDPSSQQSCSIGGNVANNSGGPHCLLYGVTSAHVLALEVVLPDGSLTMLGGLEPDVPGYDLRGAFVGSEGTMGIATRIAVRLTPNPPAVRTLLADFTDVEDAAAAVSGIIAAGIVPAALEMMDQAITVAVEDYVGAGFPRDAAAILLVEVDGLAEGVDAAAAAVQDVVLAHGARAVRVAAGEAERALLWKGRKSAFGAIARIAPNYYLHDAVVPRTRLVEVLREVYAIAVRHDLTIVNVFHAGDGNLHPLIVFDQRVPGTMERVLEAGGEIIRACVAAGGVLSGEHGIGLEKRDYMSMIFSDDDLDAQARLREVFDPDHACNPLKVLPGGSRCGDLQAVPAGGVDLTLRGFVEEVGGPDAGPVVCVGGRTQWDVGGAPDPSAREVRAPAGVVEYEPAEMVVRVGAGTTVAELDAAVAAGGQQVPLDPAAPVAATVGGVLAVGRSGLRRLRYGPVRDTVLEVQVVLAGGQLVKAGGPVVKNVSGYDLGRLLVASLGTIGFLGEVVLRCSPRPAVAAWWRAADADPFLTRDRLFRPSSILWDGSSTWVLLEGAAADVRAERAALGPGWGEVEGPPPIPAGGRRSVRPSQLRALGLGAGTFVAEIGVGTVHVADDTAADSPVPDPSTVELHRRVKAAFDPTGRMNPGRMVG